MKKFNLYELKDVTGSRYAGKVIPTPELMHDKSRGMRLIRPNVTITPEMAARIAENVRRIARHVLSPELED